MAPVNGVSPSESKHSTSTDLLLNDLSLMKSNSIIATNGKDLSTATSASTSTAEQRIAEFDPKLVPTYRQLLLSVGEDPDRDGLRKTPERAAKAIWFFTTGYRQTVKGAFAFKLKKQTNK